MCGRLNVTDDEFVRGLCTSLGINLTRTPIISNRFVRAASELQIIREVEGRRVMQKATWWLLLEPTTTGFKPSKYTSFNTRYDKLNVPRSAGYHPFRTSRCIIPARGFGETEFEQQGKKKIPKHYHDLVVVDGAIAFGGLCKEYVNKETGEITIGCSVITLPPHPEFADIHTKASPLMLPQDATVDEWLDSDNQNVDSLAHLLIPAIRNNLEVIKIDKPSQHHPILKASRIAED